MQSNQIAGFMQLKWFAMLSAMSAFFKLAGLSMMFKANDVREAAITASRTMVYEGMKSKQLQIIVTGQDVFRVLPTEHGKSLCYDSLPL